MMISMQVKDNLIEFDEPDFKFGCKLERYSNKTGRNGPKIHGLSNLKVVF